MAIFFLNLFIILLTLILVIGIHEWGHFWTARCLGIPVARFAIGFGKPLWIIKTKEGIEYVLCAIPIGGYVKFRDQAEFDAEPIYKRALVIFAGPLFNFIFAFFAYWVIFVAGVTQALPQIDKILPDSPAAKSNILPQSDIISVDHYPTQTWGSVVLRLIPHLGKSDQIILSVTHQGKISEHYIRLNHWKLDAVRPDLMTSLGLVPISLHEKQRILTRQFSVLNAIPKALQEVKVYLEFNCIILWKIITGIISLQSLAGPITLFSGSVYAAHQGTVIYIAFLGFISVGIGFANLLPIPGLDGAKLLYLGIEIIRRKPLSIALQVLLFKLGIIILSVLMFQALVNDLVRLL